MNIDREVIREIWNGKLAVCFQLDPEEVFGLQRPDPVYLMVPRLSYFPLIIDKVKKHFVRYLDPNTGPHELWLEYHGQPLKWHYPIGILFDIFCNLDDQIDQLPWSITVHFLNFPASQIFRFHTNFSLGPFLTREVIESYFMSCIKEADVLKHKKPIVTHLQKRDHNQLWTGLQNDKFDQFWTINTRFMEKDGHFKHIPFHCYFEDDQVHFKQQLVKPVTTDGQKRTLKDLLSEIFPDKSIVKVRTHGIYPPLNTPLQWMSEHLSYADNFLHLYVIFADAECDSHSF